MVLFISKKSYHEWFKLMIKEAETLQKREHSMGSHDAVLTMERKTSDLKKTSIRTSTQGEQDRGPEGRLSVGEKLRAPSTSSFKTVLGLGHNCKEKGECKDIAGGVWGTLGVLIAHFLLGWRHPSALSFLVCLLFLTLQVHTWAGSQLYPGVWRS